MFYHWWRQRWWWMLLLQSEIGQHQINYEHIVEWQISNDKCAMIFIILIDINRKNIRPTSESFDDKIGHGISANPFGWPLRNEMDERVCRIAVQTTVSFAFGRNRFYYIQWKKVRKWKEIRTQHSSQFRLLICTDGILCSNHRSGNRFRVSVCHVKNSSFARNKELSTLHARIGKNEAKPKPVQ